MKRIVLIYGLLLAVILIVLKLLDYSLITRRLNLEIYLVLIGVAFLVLGIIAGSRMRRTKIKYIEKSDNTVREVKNNVNLSNREQEVLHFIAKGYSNQEIADHLFVSLNTIKTHVNNIYVKLEVKRRTQAVSKAKDLGVID